MATYSAPDPHLASQVAALQQRFGTLDVIENQTLAIPGSIKSYDLRAQNPNGAFGGPMLQLLSGHYPDHGRPGRPDPRAGLRPGPAGR